MLEKQLLDRMLKRIKIGGLRVTYWDGDSRVYGVERTPELHITIQTSSVVRAIARNPSLGVGEAYVDGRLLIGGPLNKISELGYNNEKAFNLHGIGSLYQQFNKNIKSNQPKFIEHHYNLGNDFYKLWLDSETLGYSCSYYKTPKDTLEQAQIQKFDHILDKLRLEKGHTLLDIGFGWGYLLIRAAKRFGVKGFGVSLSSEQLRYARDFAKREGVDHLVTFELMNYQDIPKTGQMFDRVVSIGFLEHVGQSNHNRYFKTVNKVLKDGGISVLHSITRQSEGPPDPWIDKYIFPGGYIPSIREITAHLPDHDFYLKDYENIGQHYISTLAEWWRRFEDHKAEVVHMYDERFYRMWKLYLALSMGAFNCGHLSLSQWTFTKGPDNNWPLTREYLYR